MTNLKILGIINFFLINLGINFSRCTNRDVAPLKVIESKFSRGRASTFYFLMCSIKKK